MKKRNVVLVLVAGLSISSFAFASEEVLSFKAERTGEQSISETPCLAQTAAMNEKLEALKSAGGTSRPPVLTRKAASAKSSLAQ